MSNLFLSNLNPLNTTMSFVDQLVDFIFPYVTSFAVFSRPIASANASRERPKIYLGVTVVRGIQLSFLEFPPHVVMFQRNLIILTYFTITK